MTEILRKIIESLRVIVREYPANGTKYQISQLTPSFSIQLYRRASMVGDTTTNPRHARTHAIDIALRSINQSTMDDH